MSFGNRTRPRVAHSEVASRKTIGKSSKSAEETGVEESSSPRNNQSSRERTGRIQARFSSTPQVRTSQGTSTSTGSRIRSSSETRVSPRTGDGTLQWSVQRHLGDTETTQQRFPDKSYDGKNMREIPSGDFTQDVDSQGTFCRLRQHPCYSKKESMRDYTSQVQCSGLIYEELPYSRDNIRQDLLSMDKRNPSSIHLVKSSEPNVRTISDVQKEIKLNRDLMQHSLRSTIQVHTTDYSNHEKNTVDLDCEQRRPTRYCNNQIFVGLTNTGNNCCVNALLQTLFMTPEYKNLLLRCRQKGVLKKDNNHIPYHLYKVFKYLQDTTQRIVAPDKFIQCLVLNHITMGIQLDAEEIFRSLFSLLRDQLKETEFVEDINNLYIIITEEYTKCLKCLQEFRQVGYLLTIPLSLYNPSTGKCYKCIEKSLDVFFEPQQLDACNKCYCDQCGEKTTSVQGYRVLSSPQILCLQLKRFDFATNLGKAVKNYDFMAFPESLHFGNSNEEHHSQMNKWQYKLLSVIVHIGSTSFGHYYAYIRSFPEMDWYCFRDEYVTKGRNSLSSFL
ncbi:ubl carboxyl-terminal hydrolase 18-like isoform X2 [Heptranchias perlo]|uniref:ubl carboxyl-terminal hydrolase 18-like isoform X2 n=1 Tax=Heptranchias perlo TaxID=212740 RepID=UPI00355AB2E5